MAPPTPNPKGECPSEFEDLVPDSEYCYMVRADDASSHAKSWGDANTECISRASSLISIHGDGTQAGIYNKLKAKSLDVWIGLQANSKK